MVLAVLKDDVASITYSLLRSLLDDKLPVVDLCGETMY